MTTGPYATLEKGLQLYLELRIQRVKVKGDALLVVKQVLGLKNMWFHVKNLLKRFEAWSLRHIDRSHNEEAHAAAQAMIGQLYVIRADSPLYLGRESLEKEEGFLQTGLLPRELEKSKKYAFLCRAKRTAIKIGTGFSPFHLVFGKEALLPIEVEIPALKMMLKFEEANHDALKERLLYLQCLQLDRALALEHYELVLKTSQAKANAKVKDKGIKKGDMVLRYNSKLDSTFQKKFQIKWQGPFLVLDRFPNGTYQLADLNDTLHKARVNVYRLKKYYASRNSPATEANREGDGTDATIIDAFLSNLAALVVNQSTNCHARSLAGIVSEAINAAVALHSPKYCIGMPQTHASIKRSHSVVRHLVGEPLRANPQAPVAADATVCTIYHAHLYSSSVATLAARTIVNPASVGVDAVPTLGELAAANPFEKAAILANHTTANRAIDEDAAANTSAKADVVYANLAAIKATQIASANPTDDAAKAAATLNIVALKMSTLPTLMQTRSQLTM
ncbi:hypothetical protein L7F22_018302 [Adiantum nelumboides]|nr:hypothetical protein [Adiantum nelumboides]